MIQLSNNVLEKVKNRIVNELHPLAIYLYGSHAYGIPNQNSDIDFLIVVNASPKETIDLMSRAYKALEGLKIPVEINIVTQKDFEQRRHWKASVEKDVAEKGTPLYAAQGFRCTVDTVRGFDKIPRRTTADRKTS